MSSVTFEPPPDTTENDIFSRFARLTAEKRELDDRLREIRDQLKVLEPMLLTWFAENPEVPVMRVEGFSLSPHQEPWVYPATGQSRQTVCQALKACGMADYVHEQFNTKQLTTYVKQMQERCADLGQDPEDVFEVLPAELAQVIQIKPSYYIQALTAKQK